MKEDKTSIATYNLTPLARRSRLEVARQVKRGMANVQYASGIRIPKEALRKHLRHEVAHHIPLENVPVQVSSGVDNINGLLDIWTHLAYEKPGALRNIWSSIAPLSDKRFPQTLSECDKVAVPKVLLRLLKVT